MDIDEPGIYYWYMYLLDDSLAFMKKDKDGEHSEGRQSPHGDDVEANVRFAHWSILIAMSSLV